MSIGPMPDLHAPEPSHRPRGQRPARGAWTWLWAWLALVLLWPSLGAAAGGGLNPLVLDERQPSADAWPHLRVLPDASRQLTVQDMLARLPEFTAPTGAAGTLGVRQDAVWLRVPLAVTQTAAHPWIMSIDYPVLNEVDVYLVSDGAVQQKALMGNLRPFSERPLRGRTPSMMLDLRPDRQYELLVRVRTAGAMIVPLTVSKAPVLLPLALREQMLQGLLAGLALCLVVYSLTQWASQREKLFLFYALLVTGSAGFSIQFFGIGSQFLWSDNLWMEVHAAAAAGILALCSSFLFMGYALAGDNPQSRFLKTMQCGCALSGLVGLAFLADLIDTRQATAFLSIVGPMPSLISFPVALRRVRQGDTVSATLLAAWTAYFVAAAVMVGLVQGWAPLSFWTLHSFQIGATVDMLFFLRVLALRSDALRKAADDALRERDAMRALAYTDALTGLPNRRGLQLALSSAISLCAPNRLVAVYLLDLDGFKPINDQYGHDVGDDLLVAVSHRLQDHLRRKADVVARLGGDEFIIMAADLIRPEQAEELGNALLHSFRKPFVMSHLQLHVGLTIGYALAPIDAAEPRDLIRKADAAMYKGKQSGKHCLIRNDASMALAA
jgi:diguanylate cyclase (GGDEF)-like protein